MYDLRNILGTGKIKKLRVGGNTILNEVVELKDIFKAFHSSSNNKNYIPITTTGNRPRKAEIKAALSAIGITNQDSGMGMFKDETKGKVWLIYYLKDTDEYRYEKLTKAT